MEASKKRKVETNNEGSANKKSKQSNQWKVSKKARSNYVAPTIEPGDAGIWATCEMGKEGKATMDLCSLFEDYAAKLYGEPEGQADEEANECHDADADIEADIKREVQGMKSQSNKREALFQPVKVDVQCVLFFKTREPIEPVSFVHRICKDAHNGALKRHRFVKRLTPMSMMGKATVEGLDKVAQAVLGPIFHATGTTPKKFAIRPTRRNHNAMKRDDIIKQIASAVGHQHSVDLKNYEVLIIVDVYTNVLGMSVVESDFDDLKQFNLAEIHDLTLSKAEATRANEEMPNTVIKDDISFSNSG